MIGTARKVRHRASETGAVRSSAARALTWPATRPILPLCAWPARQIRPVANTGRITPPRDLSEAVDRSAS